MYFICEIPMGAQSRLDSLVVFSSAEVDRCKGENAILYKYLCWFITFYIFFDFECMRSAGRIFFYFFPSLLNHFADA